MSNTNGSNDNNENEAPLNFFQNWGMENFGLKIDQVLEPTFGEHTLRGMDKLIHLERAPTIEKAFQMLEGLDISRTEGVVNLGLDKEQVLVPNFGEHTLAGIYGLMAEGKPQTKEESVQLLEKSYELLKELDPLQTIGVLDLDLTRDQVLDPSFDEQTAVSTAALVLNGKVETHQEALEIIKEFDPFQTHGYVFENLKEVEVLDKDFGEHTVLGMNILQEQGKTSAEAFNMLQGKDATQTTKIVAQEISSTPSQDVAKDSLRETIESLSAFTKPQTPDASKEGSLKRKRDDKETTKDNKEKKSKKPRGRGI